MDLNVLNGMCRGCMSNSNEELRPLFEYNTFELYAKCTYMEVHKSDGFPDSICSSCLKKCLSWLAFKEQCEKSSKVFRNILNNKSNSQSLVIDRHCDEIENLDDDSDNAKELQIKSAMNFVEIITEDNNCLESNPDSSNDSIASHLCVNNSKTMCEKCGKTYQTQNKCGSHINTKYIDNKEVFCNLCNILFSTPGNLKRHVKINHTKNAQTQQYQCIECDKSYKFPSSLSKHLLIHTNVKSYICDTCGKGFVHKTGLQSHLLSHSKETPYRCTTCGKSFKTDSMLKIHISRHATIRKYVCSECGKMFSTSGELATHSRTHSGVRPYKCEHCIKSFKTISQLYVHIRVHTGDRPFSCEFCSQKFSAQEVLKHHRMIHTGEKPHNCNLCTKSFRQKSTLKTHMKVHKL